MCMCLLYFIFLSFLVIPSIFIRYLIYFFIVISLLSKKVFFSMLRLRLSYDIRYLLFGSHYNYIYAILVYFMIIFVSRGGTFLDSIMSYRILLLIFCFIVLISSFISHFFVFMILFIIMENSYGLSVHHCFTSI